jgi:translation initiation factor IF-3
VNHRKKDKILINDQIKNREVRVISEGGENLGIINRIDAIRLAEDAELDLVLMGGSSDDYPVCKIIDYGKYKYNQKIKKRNKPKQNKRKEIFIKTVNIGDHDMKIKLRKVVGFLEKKMEVVIGIRLKGGYTGRTNLAKDKLTESLQAEGIHIDDNNWRISNNLVAILLSPH